MANDTVDTRVVRMEFDNKQFEKNVKQTSKSLDNLKDSLDFKGVGDGLDKVRVKISALEVAATTFVVRLTNKLITLGTVMVKSLSVDNIASGWAKFGEKTISVATMMAQKIRIAGEEITDIAEKTRVVNELLEKLTWFADETSYSLSDMTNYAGKFIAAGADLDKAVNAMQGIATWAALSGQNSQTASRAMMQLAQAMGRTINRQDWMSIQTANMDTEEFREKVLETAVDLGELTKEGDKFVTKTGKKFDKSGFMNYFSEGWFTSDVLIDTLNKYSAAVGEIYEISKREGITASEVIERYGDQLDKFGKKAFLASQQARTFADVLNSVKDAVTTKWMVTFENIFGGKDEAIKLWTKLSDRLYDVFAESGNFRNNVLSIWKEAKGRDDIFGEDGAFWNLYDAIDNIRLLIKKAWDTLFPISEMESEDARAKDIARTLKKITANIKEFTKNLAMSEETAKKISRIFEIFFGILKVGLYTLLAIRYALDPIIQTLKQLTNTILTKIAAMTGGINNVLLKIEKVANRVRETLWNLIDIINPKGTLDKVFSFIKALYNVISDFKPLERLVSLTDELFKSFREGGGTQENLIKIFKGLLSIVSIVTKAFIALVQALNKYVLPILDKIITAIAKIVGFVSGVVVQMIAAVAEIITAINDAFEGNGNIGDVGDSFKNLIVNIGKAVANIIPILQSLLSIVSALIDLVLLIPKLLDAISIRLTGRGIVDNLKRFFDSIANTIRNFSENIQNGSVGSGSSSILEGVFNALTVFFKGLIELLKGLIAVGSVLIQSLGYALKVIGIALQKIADFFVRLFTGKLKELSKSQKTAIAVIAVLAALIAIATLLNYAFYRLLDAIDPIGQLSESVIDVLDRVRLTMLAKSIEQFANAILKFAVAMAILDNLKSNITKAMSAMIIIGTLIGIFVYVIDDFNDDTEQFGVALEEGRISLKKTISDAAKAMTTYRGIAKVLRAIGMVLLEIAVAAYILDKLDPVKNTFGKIIMLLAVILLSVFVLVETMNYYAALTAKEIKKNSTLEYSTISKDLKTAIGGIMALLFSTIIAMKIIEKVSPDAYNRAIGIFIGAMVGVLALVGIIGYFTTSAKNIDKIAQKAKLATAKTKKAAATFKGLALALVSISALIITVAVAMSITTKSLTNMAGATGGGSGGASGNNAGGLNLNLLIPLLSLVAIIAVAVDSIKLLIDYTKGVSKSKINQISQLLIFFSGMILAIGVSLSMISIYNWKSILAATRSIVAVLAVITLLSSVMMDMKTNIKRANQTAQLLVFFSGTLIAIATSLNLLSDISVKSIGKYVLALLGILTGMVALSFIMMNIHTGGSMLELAISMAALGSGLIVFAQGMKALADVDLKNAAKGLKLVVISLAALAAIAFISKSLIPTMLSLSAVILMISASVTALGAGLALIAKAVDNLSTSGEKFKIFLSNFADGMLTMLQKVLTGLAKIIPQVLVMLINGLGQVLEAVINLLNTYAGPLAEAVLNAVIVILNKIADHIDTIIAIGNKILYSVINGILDFIKTYIGPISDKIIDITIILIDNIAKNLPRLFRSLVDLLISVTKMLGEIIPEIIKTLVPAILDALISIWNAIMEAFGAEGGKITREEFMEVFGEVLRTLSELAGIIMKVIMQIIDIIDWNTILETSAIILQIICGILKLLIPIINEIAGVILAILKVIPWDILFKVVDAILKPIVNILKTLKLLLEGDTEAIANLWQTWWSNVKDGWHKFMDPLIDGMKLLGKVIGDWFKDIGKKIGDRFKNFRQKFKDWGKQIVEGFVQGIKEAWNRLKKGVQQWANNVANGFKKFFGIHSPSTLFAEYGKYLVQGLSIGLDEESNREQKKFKNIANNILRSFEDALFNNDDEYDYVMRVGMDISNVEKESAKVQDLMNSINSKSVEAETAYGYNASKLSSSIAASERANSKVDKAKETSTDNSINTTNNNVFNITSTDPAGAADEIDKILKKNATRAKFAKGSI